MTRIGAAAVLIGIAGSWLLAQTPPQPGAFTTRIDTVRVDVSVRENGRTLRGLTADDFEVLDNGVPQRVELASLERTPIDVVLALDVSGSVTGPRLTELRSAAARLIDLLAPQDRTALITFTERVVTGTFSTDREAQLAALARGATGRDTALHDAAHAAVVLANGAVGRPLVIIFSDGADTASFLASTQALDTARRSGVVVYAVTTRRPDRPQPVVSTTDFLDELTRSTGGRRLDVFSLDRTAAAFAEILSEARERYLLSYSPAGVAPGGWHELRVRVRNRRADIRARPGYLRIPL